MKRSDRFCDELILQIRGEDGVDGPLHSRTAAVIVLQSRQLCVMGSVWTTASSVAALAGTVVSGTHGMPWWLTAATALTLATGAFVSLYASPRWMRAVERDHELSRRELDMSQSAACGRCLREGVRG